MNNIPVFTTENGAASLILNQIPLTGNAYIKIQATQTPEALLGECVSFCRACGGEHIYASGHPFLERYPFHTAIIRMQCLLEGLPETDAALFPVLPENVGKWRNIHNEKMKDVPNATLLTTGDEKIQLELGDGYFIHRNAQLLGIGRAAGDTVDLVISCIPGAGGDVLLALCSALTGDTVRLTVASTNTRAVKLYEKMGFLPTEEVSRWYRII